MSLPHITYHLPHVDKVYRCRHCGETFSEPITLANHVRKEHPKTPKSTSTNALAAMFGGDDDGPHTGVGEFWELYHALPETATETPEAAKIRADVLAIANERHYSVKGDLNKTVRVFAELGKCPWGGEMCPCSRFKESGKCKKGMLIISSPRS